MARGGITLNDVTQAATQLQGRGQNPTVDSIRQLLGTGSKTTITQLLREWRSQQQEAAGALPRELLAIVTGLWERLNQQTEQRIESYTLEGRQETQALKEKIIQLQRDNQALQTQNHQQEEHILGLQSTSHQFETQWLHEQQAHSQLRERYQQQLAQAEESKAENKRLYELAQQMQANLQHYQEMVQQQRAEQLHLQEKQQMAFQQERNEWQQRVFDQQIHIQKLEKELQQKMHLQQDYDKLQTSYVASTRKYETLFQEHSILSERYHQLEKIANQQQAQLQDERQKKQVLEKNVIILTEKVALIGENLQQTEDKLEALRQEKLFLIQEKAESRRILETIR